MIVAVEAEKEGVTVGKDAAVSGLMFADDFVGILETPEGLQKQRRHYIEYARKSRVTANVNKCAVPSCIVCNQDKVNPGTFTGKWGENELPIADQ